MCPSTVKEPFYENGNSMLSVGRVSERGKVESEMQMGRFEQPIRWLSPEISCGFRGMRWNGCELTGRRRQTTSLSIVQGGEERICILD